MSRKSGDHSPAASSRMEGSWKHEPAARPPYLSQDCWTSATFPRDTSHWTMIRKMLTKFDSETIDGWKDEINTQLLVASLLSTLTGAFVVETQRNLSEDPFVSSAVLLSHIAMQLNSSVSPPPTTFQPFSGPSANVRAVNSLFYVSLGLSLSNVTLGLLCLQWIRELRPNTPGISDQDYTKVRWARHKTFQNGGARGVVSILPLLLLSSLVCFFAGLLFHVSTEDWAVSLPLSIVLGFTFIMLTLTTFLPAAVLIQYTAFPRGKGAKGFPSLPPFHSLQSWIALQFSITILDSFLFKKVDISRETLHELRQCPDWGHAEFHWMMYMPRITAEDQLSLPFIISTGNNAQMEAFQRCLEDLDPKPLDTDLPTTWRRIKALRYFASSYRSMAPPSTIRQIVTNLLGHLVRFVNDGTDYANVGDFSVESSPDLEFVNSRETINQLLHSMVESSKRKLPGEPSFWNFVWFTMVQYVSLTRSIDRVPSPLLITRVLNVVEQARRTHSNGFVVEMPGYRSFVKRLASLAAHHAPLTTTEEGRALISAVLFHPLWRHLGSYSRTLDHNAENDNHLIRLELLEELIPRHNLRDPYTMLDEDTISTGERFKPVLEAEKLHIAVEIEPTEPQSGISTYSKTLFGHATTFGTPSDPSKGAVQPSPC